MKRKSKGRVVKIAGGCIPLRQYIDAIKTAKANPEETFKRGFCTWWPVTGRQVVQEFHAELMLVINERGGLPRYWKEVNYERLHRKLRKRVRVGCRWCGREMMWQPSHDRFCDKSCRADFYGVR